MISVILYCKSPELAASLEEYAKKHPDFQIVERADKLEVAVPATLAILPSLVLCEDTAETEARKLMAAVSGYVPDTYFLLCGTDLETRDMLELLRLGVRDFVPKPWNEDLLWQALDRFAVWHHSLDAVRSSEQTQQLRRVLNKKFFEDTIVTSSGGEILSDFASIKDEYQISFVPGSFQAMHFLLDPRPKEPLYADTFLPVIQLESLAREFFGQRCAELVCYVKDHSLSVLLNDSLDFSDSRTLARNFLSLCARECKWLGGINTISVGIGLETRQTEKLPQLVQSAKMASWMRLGVGKGRILEYGDYYDRYYGKDEFLSAGGAAALRRSVELLDPAYCRSVIEENLRSAENAAAYVSMALAINDVLIDAFQNKGSIVRSGKYLHLAKNMPPMVENLDTLEQIENAIQAWASQCMLTLREQEANQEDADIFAAKQYAAANYTRPIRLEDAAAAVNLSSSYFCMKFRQATGQTFVEYLTGLRIEQAKELLRNTNKKIYEVAQMVGFQDARHFSRTFRKLCGMRPGEFRAAREQENIRNSNRNPIRSDD